MVVSIVKATLGFAWSAFIFGEFVAVAMTNRKTHGPTEESNEQLYLFFEQFLKPQ